MRSTSRGGRLSRRTFIVRAAIGSAALYGAVSLNRSALWPYVSAATAPGVAGVVTDLLSGEPVGGAGIAIAGQLGAVATSGPAGRFNIALAPGSYELVVSAASYIVMARTVRVEDGPPVDAGFALLPANPSDAQQEAIYAKTVQQPQWPAEGEDLGAQVAAAEAGVSVVVPDTIVVRWPDGSQTTMAMDEYLRHVVPAEMPATWPQQSLRAQAVAARSYAAAYQQARGYICATTQCQYYGDNTYSTSDEAVWATHGRVASYNGAIISAVYSAQCNGVTTRDSEQAWSSAGYGKACAAGGWNYSPYLRAAGCSGHSRYAYNDCGYHGHGVGMCQWGARGFGDQGWSHYQILQRFYTGIQITGSAPQLVSPRDGYLQLAGMPVTLRWNGGSEQYKATIVRPSDGQEWSSGWIGGLSYSLTLPAGTYTWFVASQAGGVSNGQSGTWRFTLADSIHTTAIAGITKR